MSLIVLDRVSKEYRKGHLGLIRKIRGVEDLSLEIERGEIFGLLGLNGAGKTTTIKLILGLLYPTSGEVRVMDRAMPDPSALKRMGYLPEIMYLYRYLSGREILRVFYDLSGLERSLREERISAVLDRVGMTRVASKRASEYSKGMLQRIGLAQALLHDPDILVFDEPISGLDPLALKEMRQLILWLKSEGKTIFFSSHHISEVERVCDRVAILVSGRLEDVLEKKDWQGEEGRLENIFTEKVRGRGEVGPLSFTGTGEEI